MSTKSVEQLYANIEKKAKNFSARGLDADIIALFNANLDEAKAKFPGNRILEAIRKADASETYEDLLLRAGQLKSEYGSQARRPIGSRG